MFLLLFAIFAQAQTAHPPENVIITSGEGKTRVYSENGELHLSVNSRDVSKYKAAGLVRYSDFGAKGDGKTDDIDAIAATHAFANQHGLKVKADEAATYYISGKERTAVIRTATDFGKAAFIIDDSEVQNRNASVFKVASALKPIKFAPII